jgi:CBS-domain-containing membrane protein
LPITDEYGGNPPREERTVELLDRKFKRHKLRYVGQCSLATLAVLVVLTILDAISNAAVIASLGASAFIVFALPHSRASRARVVIGGYVIGAAIGTGCYWLARTQGAEHPLAIKYITIASAATAVGLAIFLMTITDTEHPPAAGVALGLTLQEWSYLSVVVVLVGIVVLSLSKRALREWLKDLT